MEFAETFLQNYSEGQWINKERERLTNAIDRVAGNELVTRVRLPRNRRTSQGSRNMLRKREGIST